MTEGLISIVVPTYNVENYVKECLNSILNQEYKNLEIIIVDDASTDGTVDILKEYEKYSDNVHLILNEENHGAGFCRNLGLSRINGEYFMTLDSDDYFKSDFISKLYNSAKETDSDITSGEMVFLETDGTTKVKSNIEFGTYEGIYKISAFQMEGGTYINNKLIRSTLLDKVEYSSRRFIEDSPTIYKMLYYANKVTYIDDYGYIYRMREESLTHKMNTLQYKIYGAITAYELYDFFKDKGEYANSYTIFTLRNAVGGMFLKLTTMDKETYYNMQEPIKILKEQLIAHRDLIPSNQDKYYNAYMRMARFL